MKPQPAHPAHPLRKLPVRDSPTHSETPAPISRHADDHRDGSTPPQVSAEVDSQSSEEGTARWADPPVDGPCAFVLTGQDLSSHPPKPVITVIALTGARHRLRLGLGGHARWAGAGTGGVTHTLTQDNDLPVRDASPKMCLSGQIRTEFEAIKAHFEHF